MKPIDPNSVLGIGLKWGFGLEATIIQKWTLFGQCNLMYLPDKYYYTDKFTGNRTVEASIDRWIIVSVGIKYKILRNSAQR